MRVARNTKRRILELWLEGRTRDAIAQELGAPRTTVNELVSILPENLKELRKLAARPDTAELLTEQKRQNTTIAELKTTIKELETRLEEAEKNLETAGNGIEASRVSKMKDQGRPIILGEPRNRIMPKPSQEIQQKIERKHYLVAAESKGALLMRRDKPAKEDKQ